MTRWLLHWMIYHSVQFPCLNSPPASSAVGSHPYLQTHIQHWANRAAWARARADMLAERHEQSVNFDPIIIWKFGFERRHRLFWCPSLDIPPTIGHTVHVSVDANAWLVTRDAEHEVSTLGADAAQGA